MTTAPPAGSVSRRTIAGLVVAIAVIDVVANSVVPQAARVPAKLVILGGLLLWARRSARLTWEELGLGRAHVRTGLRTGGVAALAIAAVILGLAAVPFTRSYFEDHHVAAASATQHVLMPLVIIPIGTALFEEVIFRGILLGALLRVTSRVRAVLVSAAVFGLWHILPALSGADAGFFAALGAVVGTVLVTTAAGVYFAILRLRARSVLAPVLAHTALNSCSYLAALAVS